MKIAVIGAGNVGGTLGCGWAKAGHDVKFGVHEPGSSKTAELLKRAGSKANSGGVAEAAKFGDVVVFATPWGATQAAIREAGPLAGKVVVDCTNPLKDDLSGLVVGGETSGGEQVAAWAKGARVVKAFNTTGFGNMADPRYGADAATMFVAGDDAAAKADVSRLARDLGFDPVDAGPLSAARMLEPLALLWIQLAVMRGLGTNIAYRLMRR